MLADRQLRAALLLLLLTSGPGCRGQNELELSDPLTGPGYRIDGETGTLVDLRTSLEP